MSDEIGNTVEEWKAIADFPQYEVSNLGRVRRIFKTPTRDGRTFRILKQQPNKHGYLTLDLHHNGNKTFKSVSRLVALAFLEPDPDPARDEVNHSDGIKAHNHIGNLEWSTRKENVQHSYDTGLRHGMAGEDQGNSKLTNDQVRDIRGMLATGLTCSYIGSLYGVTPQAIGHIRAGRAWKHVV